MIGLGGGPGGAFGASRSGAGSGSRERPLALPRNVGCTDSAAVTSTSPGSFRFLRERPPRRVSAESRLMGLQIGTGRSSSEAFEAASVTTAVSDFCGALPLEARPRPGLISSTTSFASAFALESFFRNRTDAGAASVGCSISDFLPPRDFFSLISGSALAALLGFFLAMLKNCRAAHSRSKARFGIRRPDAGRKGPPA